MTPIGLLANVWGLTGQEQQSKSTSAREGSGVNMKMNSAYSAVIYILIRLKVKFGFSVPPVKGGLARIVLRRRTLFAISVLAKSGYI